MDLTQQELAEAFGVTTRTVRNWLDEGLPSHGEGRSRKYSLPECVEWKLSREREALEHFSDEVPAKSYSDARWAAARAMMAELDLAEQSGELLPADMVEDRFNAFADSVIVAVQSVRTRWVPHVVEAEDDQQARATLTRLVSELLESIADDRAR